MNPLDWLKIGVPAAIALTLGAWLLIEKGALASTRSTLTTVQTELGAAQRDLAIARSNTASLRSALDEANKAALNAQAAGEAADAAARVQVTAAQSANKALADRVAALQSTQPRPVGLGACQNAERILDVEIDHGPAN